jgi:hypothetical protein
VVPSHGGRTTTHHHLHHSTTRTQYPRPHPLRRVAGVWGRAPRVLLAIGESLGDEQTQDFVEKVRAWSGPTAFRLLRYLASRPDALSAPTPDCPTCGVRLIALLITAGHDEKVGLVPCADCGRTNPLPTYAPRRAAVPRLLQPTSRGLVREPSV